MLFNGANIAEQIDVSANGNRVRFFRDAGNITMDTAGGERIDFNALGGADLVTVNDLTGTDLTGLNLDPEGTLAPATASPTVLSSTAPTARTRSCQRRRRGWCEGERSRRNGQDPPPGGCKRPARDQRP
jgi:hypothetical protein